MSRKVFEIRTEPNEVVIGGTTLLFLPEVNGAAFLQAYSELRNTQGADSDDEVAGSSAALAAIETFISRFLLPESVPVFQEMDLPIRLHQAITEHLAELYGGGSEERPTSSSSGSAERRKSPGRRG